jgi:hypothetical protein
MTQYSAGARCPYDYKRLKGNEKMTIAKAKEYMQKAHDVVNGSSKSILDFKKLYAEEEARINNDKRLSPEGKQAAIADLKAQFGVALVCTAHTRKQEFVSHLTRAAKLADTIVYAKPKQPNAVKLERFEDEFKRLRTELQIAPRADFAYRKLTEFVSKIDDAYIASLVSDRFGDVATSIISAPGSDASMRNQLTRTFGELQSKFETDELREARTIMESATAMAEQPRLYSGEIIAGAVNTLAGAEYMRYLDDTEAFFQIEGNESHRPEDYKEAYDEDLDPNSRVNLSREYREAVLARAQIEIDQASRAAEEARQRASEIEARIKELEGN